MIRLKKSLVFFSAMDLFLLLAFIQTASGCASYRYDVFQSLMEIGYQLHSHFTCIKLELTVGISACFRTAATRTSITRWQIGGFVCGCFNQC